MPKVVATGSAPAISILPGASYYRFAGLEFYSTSNQGCGIDRTPRVNCFTYFLLDMPAESGKPLPESITVDRCYMHGSDTQDIRAAVVANGTGVAVIDSYISDIHHSTYDSQAIRAFRTPGPIKVVNNFLSATTENLMFGGAGGADNPYVASDLEIRSNHFYKPERWAVPGITMPPAAQWSVKNLLEFKSARRVVVSGNVFENNWLAAQSGFAIVLTVRTSDSGNIAVVDDITIENNLLTNVASGFNSGSRDDLCKLTRAPLCNNPGRSSTMEDRQQSHSARRRTCARRQSAAGMAARAWAGRRRDPSQHRGACSRYKLLGIDLFSCGGRQPLAAGELQHPQCMGHGQCALPTSHWGLWRTGYRRAGELHG